MRALFASVLEAFAYFSTFRIPSAYTSSAPSPRSLSALPIVGAFIGAIAGAIGSGIALKFPPVLGNAAAFTAVVLLSGAIHFDGFLDSCDALFASTSVERRLEILKDPRHGTFAVLGMAILAVWWLSALSVTRPADLPLRLAFACALARAAAIVPAYFHRYARATASSALESPPNSAAAIAWIAILAAISIVVSRPAWITIPATIIAAVALARWISARLGGGLVGDSYGFIISVLEPLVVAIAAVA